MVQGMGGSGRNTFRELHTEPPRGAVGYAGGDRHIAGHLPGAREGCGRKVTAKQSGNTMFHRLCMGMQRRFYFIVLFAAFAEKDRI